MKITVRISDVEIVVDRPNFEDYKSKAGLSNEWRKNTMNDTVLPALNRAIEGVKELFQLKNKMTE